MLGKGVTKFAVLREIAGILQGAREVLRGGPVMLKQMKRHALGRLYAHSGQAFQGLDQGI